MRDVAHTHLYAILSQMKTIIPIVLLVLFLPLITLGAQKVISEKRLKSEYNSQVRALDIHIKSLEKPIQDKKGIEAAIANSKREHDIEQVKQEKLMLVVTYRLLSNSFE